MAAGVACGLQNRREARIASWVGSTPTRSRHLLLGALTLALLIPGSAIRAQEPVEGDTAAVGPVSTAMDSVERVPTGERVAVDSTGLPVSPMGAFFRSLILPGWGQASVDQPVRGAFYFTMEAASLWMLFKAESKLRAAERAGDEDLAAARKEQKEDWIVMAVFWALFSGVDAWVSTHMWDFEGVVVPPPDGSRGVAVQVSIPVGGP